MIRIKFLYLDLVYAWTWFVLYTTIGIIYINLVCALFFLDVNSIDNWFLKAKRCYFVHFIELYTIYVVTSTNSHYLPLFAIINCKYWIPFFQQGDLIRLKLVHFLPVLFPNLRNWISYINNLIEYNTDQDIFLKCCLFFDLVWNSNSLLPCCYWLKSRYDNVTGEAISKNSVLPQWIGKLVTKNSFFAQMRFCWRKSRMKSAKSLPQMKQLPLQIDPV